LCYKAVEERDEVGIMTFTGRIEAVVAPTRDFPALLAVLAQARAGMETDIAKVLLRSVEVFTGDATKHLVLLTDAVPTKGKAPKRSTLEAAGVAAHHGVRVSIVGIGLDDEGRELAEQIVEMTGGRLYKVTDLSELDTILLEEYTRLKQ
ncbi:VWA domain-containing protein, partial [Candidatus Woesearchaeota archaeon]